MDRFLKITYWQLLLLLRYKIFTIAIVIGILYCALILSLPAVRVDLVVIPVIFSDPAMLGFIFIGALILFEKSDNTIPALVVTPMKSYEFLWSKALALLVPALVISFAVAVSAYGFQFNAFALFLGVGFSSIIFSFLGFIGASRVRTFNQYIIVIPLFLLPAVLPLLNVFQIIDFPALNLIPTYSMLTLLFEAVEPSFNVDYLINVAYLTFWLYLSFRLAKRSYYKYLMA